MMLTMSFPSHVMFSCALVVAEQVQLRSNESGHGWLVATGAKIMRKEMNMCPESILVVKKAVCSFKLKTKQKTITKKCKISSENSVEANNYKDNLLHEITNPACPGIHHMYSS